MSHECNFFSCSYIRQPLEKVTSATHNHFMNDNVPEANPKSAPKRWTREEETALTALFKAGTSTASIAEQFGRSQGAINARLAQLDLISYGPYTKVAHMSRLPGSDETPVNSSQPWEEETEALLLTLHKTSPTADNILTLATDLGRSPRSLVLKLVQLGELVPELNSNPEPDPNRTLPPAAAELAEKQANTRAKQKPIVKRAAPQGCLKLKVTSEFQAAKRTLDDGHNLLILGSAGTGKSTFLKWIRHQYDQKEDGKKYVVLAPTGMAALNVGGQTIHSFFGFKVQLLDGSSSSWRKPRNPKLFKKLELIIIDEISMVRADVLTTIDRFLRQFGPNANAPFGGVQILALGDLFQLSPIVSYEDKDYFQSTYGTPFFFGSPSFNDFVPLEFTEIFRQADAPFINLLSRIRHGEKSPDLLTAINQRHVTSIPADVQKSAVILAARNRTVDTINERELRSLNTPTFTYSAIVSGKIDAKSFLSPEELTLKQGAHVMFTRNDANGRWVNGSMGTVTNCDNENITVKLSSGETYDVEQIKWELTKYDIDPKTEQPVATVAGSFTQFPLTLAWALTIHKAQGQTLEQCIIDLSDGGTFADGQLYVALSRARSLESMYLTTPIQAKDIRTAADIKNFYNALPKSA